MGLSLYTGVLLDAAPNRDGDRAALLYETVHDDVVSGGVAHPDRLTVPESVPADVDVGVALVTRERRWTAGPADTDRPVPTGSAVRTGRVSVRVAPGETSAGELRVVVRS